MPHRMEIDVRFYELDPYDHLNHSAYIQYFEVGRIEALRSIGCTLTGMRAEGWMIVVSEISTQFLASAGEGDHLAVETEVIEIRRVTSRWHQRILRGDEVIAIQEVKAAMVDLNGRPVRFPEDLVAALAPYHAES